MAEIQVQYVGGEQDGRRELIEVDDKPSLIIFVWRNSEDERMRKAKGDARKALADKLGVLAYRYGGALNRPNAPDGVEYLYSRWPQADKKMTRL